MEWRGGERGSSGAKSLDYFQIVRTLYFNGPSVKNSAIASKNEKKKRKEKKKKKGKKKH